MSKIKLNIKVTIEEYNDKASLTDVNKLKQLQNELSQHVKTQTDNTIKTIQKKYKLYIFGFGLKLHQQHRKKWDDVYKEKWDEMFPNILVHVEVDSKILNTGQKIRSLIDISEGSKGY